MRSLVDQRQDLEALHKQCIIALNTGDLDTIKALITDDVKMLDAMGKKYSGRSDAETALARALPMLKGGFESIDGDETTVKCEVRTVSSTETRCTCGVTAMGMSLKVGLKVVWEGLQMAVVESCMNPAAGWEDEPE